MSNSNRTNHVLIIEDNPDNQQLASWILEDQGFDITCTDTAEDGLELIQKNSYDFVLMDISLPGMDGKEATRAIRAMPNHKHIPILALTAHAVKGERELILASGVDGLLTKPVDEDELIAAINALLNER